MFYVVADGVLVVRWPWTVRRLRRLITQRITTELHTKKGEIHIRESGLEVPRLAIHMPPATALRRS